MKPLQESVQNVDKPTRPTLSVSQSFDYGTSGTSVAELETAIRVWPSETENCWSVASLVFYVVVGRRPQNKPDSVFDVDWNATPMINRHGGIVRMYSGECVASEPVPCTLKESRSWQLREETVLRTEQYAWGVMHLVAVDLRDRDGNVTVTIDPGSQRWFSLISLIPATEDGYSYEHWIVVGNDSNQPLAFIDRHNTFGQDWTDWKTGSSLKNNLYDGLEHPSAFYGAYGLTYCDPDAVAGPHPMNITSPAPEHNSTKNHTTDDVPSKSDASESIIDKLGGPVALTMLILGCLSVVVIVGLVGYAIFKRKTSRRKIDLRMALSEEERQMLEDAEDRNRNIFYDSRDSTSSYHGYNVDARDMSSSDSSAAESTVQLKEMND